MSSSPASPKKSLTAFDHRIEAAVGQSIDQLWKQRDDGRLDEQHSRVVDAHRSLVQAETDIIFYRSQLQLLASGEFPADVMLVEGVDRAVDQLEQAIAVRDERERTVGAVLEPVEAAARSQAPCGAAELSAPDFAALLAIAQGATLRQYLLTGQVSVLTASGTHTKFSRLQRLETAGLVVRDTSHTIHTGQPVTLTDAGRAILGDREHPGGPTTSPPARRPVNRPAAARTR
ncbi:hypothetical protein [Streptomyces sp. NPDC056244]|uniref:hypothetical protein n=1 Tax=Streptomyces sp. NPDC056244 TaxID=3345762 RepID=UPI0035E25B32